MITKRSYVRSVDRIGQKFHSWTIIGLGKRQGSGRWFFCQCNCGHKQLIPINNLVAGYSRQCRNCSNDSLRLPAKHCVGCGTEISRQAIRCFTCANNAKKDIQKDKPKKYPISIGTLARKNGISRQAIHICIKKYGFEEALKRYG